MNRSSDSLQWGLGKLCLCLVLHGSCSAVKATEHVAEGTIDELLRLDSQAALAAAQKNVFNLNLPQGSPGSSGAQPFASDEVVAIYGLGTRLVAEVLIGSERYVFQAFRAKPLVGPSLSYALERITPPCVYVKKEAAVQTQTLCVRGAGPAL